MNIITGMPGAHVDPIVGAIRFNTTLSTIEMWDGHNWVVTSSAMAQQETPELKIKVGSVAGIVYNCIEPIGKPWANMFQWCVDTMGECGNKDPWGGMHPGPDNIVPHARWYINDSKFWFKDPEDQVMFILRWS